MELITPLVRIPCVPLCYLRRPLFLVLVFYMLFLALLHSRGCFEVRAPREFLRFRDYPSVRMEGMVVSPLREDFRGRKLIVRAGRIEGAALGQKVLVYLTEDLPYGSIPRPGQGVALEGSLRLPRPARNPGEFDERAFLSDRGIAWIMKASSSRSLPGSVPWAWLPLYGAESVRRSMEARFRRFFEEDEARVLTGITLGYKGPLSRPLNRAVQDAGVMHLLVPSGAKVAFALLAASAFSSWLGLRVSARFSFCAAAGGFYTLMVGLEPPYVRAYLGALALYGGILLDRESGAFQAMALSALAILIFDPRALFSAGFQMTYLAMAGLVAAMPAFNRALPRAWPVGLRRLGAMGAVTVIVELMLWPVFANVFGRGSLVGALANLLLVPASGLIMAGGFGVWAASLLTQGSALGLLVRGMKGLLGLFRLVCFHFASWPCAAIDLAPMGAAAVISYYLAVFALLLWPRRKLALALFSGAVLLWGGRVCAARLGAAPLRVVYLRLPGNPALVTFEGNRHWLVAGKAPAGAVLKALKAYRVGRLEKILWAGSGRGSGRGLSRILREIPAGEIERPQIPSPGVGRRLELVCQGTVCFGFDPPSVRRGESEFSIIPIRLQRHAVQVETNGLWVKITDARGKAVH